MLERLPYIIDREDFNIMIGDGKIGPPIYVELRAHFLYSLGFKQAYFSVAKLLLNLIEVGRFVFSRLDICAYLVGIAPDMNFDENVMIRTKKEDFHFKGSRLNGFSYGKGGDMSFRIYNKCTEISKKGNDWINEVWKFHGWSEQLGEVWRVEYQIRKEVLNNLG